MRAPATHYNLPDDDVRCACGRRLRKVKLQTTEPTRVTCVACKKAMAR